MRLKTKLFLGIFLIAFLASGATGSFFYYQAKTALLESIRQQLKATAKIAALLVDGDMLESLTEQKHMATAEYQAIQDLMGVIAQSNAEYLFAYTMRLDHGIVRFVVDSPAHDDDGDGVISEDELPEPLGAIYPDPPDELLQGFVRPSSDQKPHTDQWATTMSGYAPIHNRAGQAVDLIGIDMSLDRVDSKLTAIRQAGLASLGLAALVAMLMGWYFSLRIFSPLAKLERALTRVAKGDYAHLLDERGRDEISAFAKSYNDMVRELKEKAWMKASLGKVLGPQAAAHLLQHRLQLGGEMREATILVCDLRGFSRLSEKLPPKLLVGLINDYFTAMVEVIQKNKGMVDKFVGDMVLAVFGHPVPLENARKAALTAARELIHRCDALNDSLQLSSDLHLENSVGLHCGPVLAGTIGSPERMEYTVMGLTVNVAVRMEKMTRELGVRLAASGEFVQHLDQNHGLIHAGSQPLPGMRLAMDVYVVENDVKKADEQAI